MADLARLNLWKSMSSMQPLQAAQFNTNMSVIEQVLNALNYDLETGNFTIQPSQVTNAMIDRATIDRLVVVTGDIADATISNAKLDRATANRISIIEADIADAAIATAKIRDAAITNAKIDRVTADKLVVSSADIANAAILTAHISDLSVTTGKIEDAAINAAKIENASITNAKIDRATANKLVITTADIADAAIKSAQIDDAQITRAKIADGAIDRALIDTAAIGTTQIADGSITDAKIVELTANKITSGVLSTERLIIRDSLDPTKSLIYEINNITGALQVVQGDTVNGEVLTERSITKDKIVAKSITADEIAAKSITANEMVANTITAASGVIADAAITNAMIANLDAGKITTGTLDANRVSLKFGGKNLAINSNFSKTKEAYPKRDEPQWSLYWRFIHGWQVKAASEQSSTSFEQGWLYTARRFWQFSYEPAIHVKSETSPAHYAEEDDQNPDEGGYPVLPGEVYTLSVLAIPEQWSANSRLKLAYSPGDLAHTYHDIFAAPLMANDPNYKTGAVLSDKTYTLNQLEAWNGIDGTPYYLDYVDFRPTRFWVTFTVPEGMIWDNKLNLIFLDNRSSSTDMSLYSEVQLERGNVVTDWSPAQEDLISSGVSYQGITIDTIDGLVSDAVINGKTVSVKLNSTDGLSFYENDVKIGGVENIQGKVALATDLIKRYGADNDYIRFDPNGDVGTQFAFVGDNGVLGANVPVRYLSIDGSVDGDWEESQVYIRATPFNVDANGNYTASNYVSDLSIGVNNSPVAMTKKAEIKFHGNDSNPSVQITAEGDTFGNYSQLSVTPSGAFIDGNKVWHSGNDGSGSGLDADTVDGNQASAFAPSSHTHSYLPLAGGTLSGALTLYGGGNVPVVSSVYSASSGVLVDICPDNISNMIVVEVVGNGYATEHPIRSIFQTYHYTPYGTFLSSKQINISGNLPTGTFMIHNERVKLWFPQGGSYQTFIVNAYGMNGVIYKTNTSNSSEPTSSYKSTCSLKTILDSSNWSSYAAPASHTHSYVEEGGTTFTGTYPMVSRIGANNYYSHSGITFIGLSSTLKVNGPIYEAGTALSTKYAPTSHSHDYAPSTGSAFYINRNSDGSCIQIPAPADVHVNRASGFYMAYAITNSPTADWWFFVYMKIDANACTVFAYPCNAASTPRWKRYSGGTWTSWANLNVSI